MIRVKEGVDISQCSGEILYAVILINPLFHKYGIDTVLTSGHEPYKHSAKRSAHYRKDAVDVRSRQVLDPDGMVEDMREVLGPNYVVLFEGNHFHIHWGPVYAGS